MSVDFNDWFPAGCMWHTNAKQVADHMGWKWLSGKRAQGRFAVYKIEFSDAGPRAKIDRELL